MLLLFKLGIIASSSKSCEDQFLRAELKTGYCKKVEIKQIKGLERCCFSGTTTHIFKFAIKNASA